MCVDIGDAETVSDATKCYEWVQAEGSPLRQHYAGMEGNVDAE